jgi:cytochrome c biogenesis protein CcdA
MPLVQAADNKREWLKIIGVIGISTVLVTTLFGALLGAPASALAGTIGNRRNMALLMQPALIALGLLTLVVALGELGLIRRLVPEIHPRAAVPRGGADAGRGRYRWAIAIGVASAVTFGVICTKPLYLALLVYVALVGSVAYGALTLGAYGVGLALSLALGGLALRPASRSSRFMRWLAEREDTFRVVQGVVFALSGGMSVAFFYWRYAVPPT